jgi:hypothetical protein
MAVRESDLRYDVQLALIEPAEEERDAASAFVSNLSIVTPVIKAIGTAFVAALSSWVMMFTERPAYSQLHEQ